MRQQRDGRPQTHRGRLSKSSDRQQPAIAIANSTGVEQFFRSTDSAINIKAIAAKTPSGYAEKVLRDAVADPR